MERKRVCGLLIGILMVCACSSQSQQPLSANAQLEQEVIALQGAQVISVSKWRRSAKQAQQLQNWPLAVTSLRVLCQAETSPSQKNKACENLSVMTHLVSDKALLFDTYLTLHLHYSQSGFLDKAEALARTPEHKARVAIAKGSVPSEVFVKDKLPKADLAQFYYLSGKRENNTHDLQQAVQLFAQAGLTQKQADSHFLLAKLYQKKGNDEGALEQAALSYVLLDQIDNHKAADAVVRWINEHAKSR